MQFLGVSIWTYKDRSVAQRVTQVVTHPAEEAATWGAVWLPILLLYSPVQIVCSVFSLSFMLATPSFVAAGWVGFMALYYMLTLPGAPEHTGRLLFTPWCDPSVMYIPAQTASTATFVPLPAQVALQQPPDGASVPSAMCSPSVHPHTTRPS